MPEPASALIVLFAAAVQGFLGFGFGIVAMSGLTLSVDLLHAAGVVNVTGMLVTSSVFWALRHGTLWRRVGRILPGMVAGVAIGVTALGHLDREWMVRALGVTVVGISAWNLLARGLRPPRDARIVDLGVGLVSGMLGGAFNTGGPPLVAHLYRRPEPPDSIKATVQVLFLSVGLTRLPLATAQGLMDASIWRDSLLAAPFALAGLALGIAAGRRLGAERFRRVAWVALGTLGLALLASG